jgi:predicted nucleic acid-binding protein
VTTVWDTTVLIDILRGSVTAQSYARSLQATPVCSEMTRIEVLRGVRTAERAATERLLGALVWVPVDETIARRAGELGRRFRSSHPGLGSTDLAIAATALELEARLATTNVRHFPMFRRLRPPY